MPLPETGLKGDIRIGKGALCAVFRPEAGGRMSRLLHVDCGDLLIPMDEADFRPLDWPKAGAYPLFPFHNRVIGGILHHAGRRHRLAPHPRFAPDTIHGPAHRRPWQLMQADSDTLSLGLDYHADEDWPFTFRAEQDFAIETDCLSITLRLINKDERPMPGGLGWHPFFRADLSRQVTTDARMEFPLNAIDLPTGEPATERCAGALPARAGYTQHLACWRKADIMTDGGAWIRLAPTAGLAHLAVHRTASYVCLEPVSHRAGALHQPGALPAQGGLVDLPPGATLEGRFDLRITGRS
ncbi:aldose 1-epimerase [Rhizobium sp. CSW-27]|uniref:aldose epimerase family protein n=1 Tax=Rhizobium sp. CSW-27 TaxID=2839985 RepID=UPI001C02A4E4|nr:aldose 1-epimerase [Rhizobium sp. CSW-27]MBT9369818.1 aldose 1-epimerase [Rhizobium sp. CSW-27]